MEFGKLHSIDHVNWTLPPDDEDSMDFLKQLPQKKSGETQFYIGTPAWGRKEWIGKIYPFKTQPKNFLRFYSQVFNTIELNTTHYQIPSKEKSQEWLGQVSENFLFCPKLFQGISHSSNGLLDKNLLKDWFYFLENLKSHLGPVFAQFPPHFDYSRKAQLFKFVEAWPKDFELSLELRHPSWFQNNHVLAALRNYLQTKGVGLVILDVAGRRDLVHTSVSAPFVQLRLIGNSLHPSDIQRVQDWSIKFEKWSSLGLKKVFFFAHQPDDILAPEFSREVVKILNHNCHANLQSIPDISQIKPTQKSFL